MKLVEVKALPTGKRTRLKNLQRLINDFVNSDAKICRIEFIVGVDYASVESCQCCWSQAVRRSGHLNVGTRRIDNEVYLVKKV